MACEKLISNFRFVGQSSQPHAFARVSHALLVGRHGGAPVSADGGEYDCLSVTGAPEVRAVAGMG